MFYNRLKQYYSHAVPADHNAIPEQHQLVITEENGESLVIDKRLLTKAEVKLLETLFNQETDQFFTPKSTAEAVLHSCLLQQNDVPQKELDNLLPFPCRFIHFFIKGSLGNVEELEDALKNLFPVSPHLLWKNPQEGFIIQAIDKYFEDDVSFASVTDTITSDFFVQIFFYIGSPVADGGELASRFQWEAAAFESVKGISPKKHVFVEQEVIPYMIIKDLQDETKESMLSLLQPVMEDSDLMESVKMYLECNMNASMAAKKLYMHRNTIQYRVDKFIEKTSIDIKQFPNAVAVYFMFIATQKLRPEQH
nr:helix-turn-helix domain-containing protein [Evansella caseinilytica]